MCSGRNVRRLRSFQDCTNSTALSTFVLVSWSSTVRLISCCGLESNKSARCIRSRLRTRAREPALNLLSKLTITHTCRIFNYMAAYSTAQVAKKLRVGRDTLHRWLRESLKAPRKRKVGGVSVRIWSETDFRRARRYKAVRYRKGRGRKGKSRK